MTGNFSSSKDSEETRTINSKSDNIEISIGNETDEIIKEIFEFFLPKQTPESFRIINKRK